MRQHLSGMGQKLSKQLLPQIKAGQRVFVHGQSAVPYRLLEDFVELTAAIPDLEFVHLHVEGSPAHFAPQTQNRIRIHNFFIGPEVRNCVDGNRVDYIPIFLSEIPNLIKSGRLPIDIALIQVSTPDSFGYCSLGVSVDIARAAIDSAKLVIAQINPRMPRTHGDSMIHISKINDAIEFETPLVIKSLGSDLIAADLEELGKNVASLIENGSTLQLGIGAIPNAVLKSLTSHRQLGIHSEMISDGVMQLMQQGVIDNTQKIVHPGKTISSFVQGSQALYDFIHENPSVELYPADYVNSPSVIARNPKVIAINSAVQVDLTGQVCADSVGHRMISGVGGQVDFMRGAALSPGGKPIIAITSRTKSGKSRIVPELLPGAGVVTSRGDVHFVVTEYGVADLFGKSLGERARALIAIAHPQDRESLREGWQQVWRQVHP